MYFLSILFIVPVIAFAQGPNERVRVPPARNDDAVSAAPFTVNRNRIRVATLANTYPPFANVRSDCVDADPATNKECRGSKRYEGYCVKLMDAIREHLPGKPQYEFDVSQNDFNGVLGLLQRREVDISCAPIVSTQDRVGRAVEFSQPFVNSSISIMMKRPDDSF
uniref:Ionotropic glutamate receptor L-glutamate and glycine-binding domain-containing protein n=1 Tax=Ditylenchus dipsaci TaxID=166011 RepID=A0A915CNC8_9BILA